MCARVCVCERSEQIGVSLTVGGGRRRVAGGCGVEGGVEGWPRNVVGGSCVSVEG